MTNQLQRLITKTGNLVSDRQTLLINDYWEQIQQPPTPDPMPQPSPAPPSPPAPNPIPEPPIEPAPPPGSVPEPMPQPTVANLATSIESRSAL
jgi:hypothetical protein